MRINHRRLDDLRRGRGPIQEHFIDELVAGHLPRREFLRRGSMIGLSVPLLGAILEACGSSAPSSSPAAPAAGRARAGATIRVGGTVPASAINPITISDPGGLNMLAQVGEWLVFGDQHFNYHPWLATSWSPNADASVWTFKIRQGVKFNDGRPMTVDDVVYSVKSQCDPNSSANALSVFAGTLVPDGVVKVDDTTVAFHLEAPDASFVDAIDNYNYNMIIVPNGFNFAKYQKSWIGTGAFMNSSYSPNVGATFVRNPHYWRAAALPKELQFTFFPSEAPMTAALEAGANDCDDGMSVAISPQLLTGQYNIIALKASTHRELSMRNDILPFTNKYVRQAIAYTLDRPAIVEALFKGYAQVGNDSPFAPIFKAANTSVPQRTQNLKLAPDDRRAESPYLGTAVYYSARAGEALQAGVAWSYQDPVPECPKIAGLICFEDSLLRVEEEIS